jgi:hypothetical protein
VRYPFSTWMSGRGGDGRRMRAVSILSVAGVLATALHARAQPAPSSTAAPTGVSAEPGGTSVPPERLVLVSTALVGLTAPEPPPPRSEWPAYVMGGAGAVVALAGGTLLGVGLVIGRGEAAQRMVTIGVPTVILGGLSIAGAVVYALWPASSPTAARPVWRVLPVVGPGGGGLAWVGSF